MNVYLLQRLLVNQKQISVAASLVFNFMPLLVVPPFTTPPFPGWTPISSVQNRGPFNSASYSLSTTSPSWETSCVTHPWVVQGTHMKRILDITLHSGYLTISYPFLVCEEINNKVAASENNLECTWHIHVLWSIWQHQDGQMQTRFSSLRVNWGNNILKLQRPFLGTQLYYFRGNWVYCTSVNLYEFLK